VTAEPRVRSPLAPRADDLARLGVVELRFVAQVTLRAGPADVPFAPPVANTVGRWGDRDVLGLGPDEWLVVGKPGTAVEIVSDLHDALTGTHHSAVDTSANRAVLELSGPDRRSLLEQGCGLDLHPRSWRSGMCAQTLLAKTQVVLQQVDAERTRIFVRPSFAEHLIDWMLRVGGPADQAP